MARNPNSEWIGLAHDSYWLWAESMMVIGLRTTDMMAGRGTAQETTRMVTEKLEAASELGLKLAFGGFQSPEKSARTAVRYYRKRVTANRKRLSPGR